MQISLLSNRQRLLELFITSMLILFLILLPRYTDYSKAFFYLLCLLGLITLIPGLRDYRQVNFQEKTYLLVIVINFLWIWFCYYINGQPDGGSSILQNRQFFFLMFIPLYLLFRQYPVRSDTLLTALFVSAVVATGDIMLALYAGVEYRYKGMNPNAFGPILLCVAGMLFISFWYSSYRWRKMLYLLGFVFAIVAVVLSQSRGTWLAVPFLSIFFLLYLGSHWSWLKKITVLVLIAALCAGAYFVPIVKDRIDQGISLTQAYFTAESPQDAMLNSSPGIRYQLWEAAWKIFLDNPVTGVGVGGYKPQLKNYELNENAYKLTHAHNQYLTALATRGVPGLVFVLAILAMPISIALARRSPDIDNRISSASLIFISISFAINNLTDDHFEHKPTILFFVLMIALHLARKPATSPG